MSSAPGKSAFTDDQLILAARLSYIENLPQARIAKLVNASQAQVSRMLALARERGLVRITVAEREPRDGELERRLQERCGLTAVVIRTVPGLAGEDLRGLVGISAAPTVAGWLHTDGMRIAVAGGRTLRALVDACRPSAPPAGITVLQAMGHIDAMPGPADAMEIGRTLAAHLGGTFSTLGAPVFLPDAATCRRLSAHGHVGAVLGELAHADIALVGIGTLADSLFIERGALTPADHAALVRAGAVGEVLGRFVDQQGVPCRTGLEERTLSLPLAQLAAVPRVVAVVAGRDRAAALRAVAAGGVVREAIIDQDLAHALLEESA